MERKKLITIALQIILLCPIANIKCSDEYSEDQNDEVVLIPAELLQNFINQPIDPRVFEPENPQEVRQREINEALGSKMRDILQEMSNNQEAELNQSDITEAVYRLRDFIQTNSEQDFENFFGYPTTPAERFDALFNIRQQYNVW